MERMKPDENAVDGAFYPIVSMYYDSPDRDCYWEHARNLQNRRKLRIRVYGSPHGKVAPTIFVEIKHKWGSRGSKRRLRCTLEEAYEVCSGKDIAARANILDHRMIDEIHSFVKNRDFQPCCAMRYDRHAFMDSDPASDLRVTFDTDIAYRFENLRVMPDDRNFEHLLLPESYSVMEVKVTDAVPLWLTQSVGRHHCILQSHSKYSNALEAGDPVLRKQTRGHLTKTHYGLTPESLAKTRVNAVAEPTRIAVAF